MKRTFLDCLINGRYYYKNFPLSAPDVHKYTWYQIVVELLPRHKIEFCLDINFQQPRFCIRALWFSVLFEKEMDLPF